MSEQPSRAPARLDGHPGPTGCPLILLEAAKYSVEYSLAWAGAATDQSLGQAPAQRGGLERKEISLVFSLFTIPSGGRPGEEDFDG